MDRKGSAGGRLGVIQLCAFVWTPSLRRTSDSGVGDDLPNQAALGLFAFYSERLWRQSRKSVRRRAVVRQLRPDALHAAHRV